MYIVIKRIISPIISNFQDWLSQKPSFIEEKLIYIFHISFTHNLLGV